MSMHEYPDSPQSAVGAIVIRDDEVLLVKRNKPPGRGLWSIPGGSIELGETLQEAAEREIMEETGVIIRAKEPIYTFDVIERDDEGHIRFHYVIVDLLADYVSGEPSPRSDASEACWVSPRALEELVLSRITRKVLRETLQFGR
jgi:8-oxo-dGTP diphosphatase